MARTVVPWTDSAGQPAFYRQIAQASQRFTDEVQPLYPTISVLVLIIWDKEDTWIPVSNGYELMTAIPGSAIEVIEGAGHLVIEEQPHPMCDAALAFLSQ